MDNKNYEKDSNSNNKPSTKRVKIGGNLYKPVLPLGAISIARPSKFSNPFKVKDYGREEAIRLFEEYLVSNRFNYSISQMREELKGKDIACWCKLDEECHGDIILKYL